MNQEIWLSNVVGIRLLFVALIGWIYSRAGRGWKWPILGKVRRKVWLPVLTAICLTTVMLLTSKFTWMLLAAIWLTVPIQFGVMSLFSYGTDSWLRIFGKVIQRIIVHGSVAAAPILVVLLTKRWDVYFLGITISAIVGAWMGVRNPIPAPEEEGMIGFTEFAYIQFLV